MTVIETTTTREIDSFWTRLTIADGILAVIMIVGAVLRLADLGGELLRPDEADQALAVWYFWQPAGEAWALGSPAYFTLTNLLTQFLGYGESVMRLMPALAGVVLVGLPWLLRHRLGRVGTLAASLLLAVSPTAVASARTAGGDSLALSSGLLLFISWLRYQETGERRWLYALSGALGLGLATAPIFFGLLLTLALAWLIQLRFGPELLPARRPDNDLLRAAAISGGIVFAGAATFFLWQPAGFGAALTNLADWLRQFSLPPDALTWLSPILALGRYEIGILLLGTIGIAWATWRNLTFPTLLVYWFSASLLLVLLQGGTMVNVLLLVLPGYLLLATFIDDSVTGMSHPYLWPGVFLLVALTLGVVANTGRHYRMTFNQVDPAPTVYLFGALFCLLFMGAVLSYFLSWRPRLTLAVVMWTALLLLTGYGWGTAWWLGHDAHNDARERWVQTGTDPDVRNMLDLMTQSARHAVGNDQGLAIVSSVDSPVLRWYLRDRPDVTFGASAAGAANADILITTGGDDAGLAGYVGQPYGLRRVKTEPLPSPNLLRDVYAWWFFHVNNTPPVAESIVFWLRADLVPGQ